MTIRKERTVSEYNNLYPIPYSEIERNTRRGARTKPRIRMKRINLYGVVCLAGLLLGSLPLLVAAPVPCDVRRISLGGTWKFAPEYAGRDARRLGLSGFRRFSLDRSGGGYRLETTGSQPCRIQAGTASGSKCRRPSEVASYAVLRRDLLRRRRVLQRRACRRPARAVQIPESGAA